MSLSTNAAAAREENRAANGQFGQSVRAASDITDLAEIDWEAAHPDFDDYTMYAEDAVDRSGLANLKSGEIFWDYEQTGFSNSLGFTASGSFTDVETEFLDEDLADRVRGIEPTRDFHIANYAASHMRMSNVDPQAQYVSVELTDAERNAVVEALSYEGHDFADDLVSHWANGDPKGLQDTFGYVNPHKQWLAVSDAVRLEAPIAGDALDVAEALRKDAVDSFDADVEHTETDEWKQARATNSW
jgi:hypothetical protein